MGNNKQICCNKETLLYITYYIEESRFKKKLFTGLLSES